jgi:hypothetical protein
MQTTARKQQPCHVSTARAHTRAATKHMQRARTQAASAACAPVHTATPAPTTSSPHVTAAEMALATVSTAKKQ